MDTKSLGDELLRLKHYTEKQINMHSKIVNSSKTIIGISVGVLRKFARDVCSDITYDDLVAMLKDKHKYYEQTLVIGFIINYKKFPTKLHVRLTKYYLRHADSWALVDSFVASNKGFKNNEFFSYAIECLESRQEFFCRFGIVLLMNYFLSHDKLEVIFDKLKNVKSNKYYVKMALAWLYATTAITFFDKTIKTMNHSFDNGIIDKWTYNKALQKMIESYRISKEKKSEVRALKK